MTPAKQSSLDAVHTRFHANGDSVLTSCEDNYKAMMAVISNGEALCRRPLGVVDAKNAPINTSMFTDGFGESRWNAAEPASGGTVRVQLSVVPPFVSSSATDDTLTPKVWFRDFPSCPALMCFTGRAPTQIHAREQQRSVIPDAVSDFAQNVLSCTANPGKRKREEETDPVQTQADM
jgi:hypothetical protein